MKLLNCQIVNFGCLSNCSFSFDDGLNLLFAKNGTGKSTLAAFLKAMLYGLPSVRKGGYENERRRYTPWQGGTFGGVLCFEAEGEEYRLEHFFGAKERDDRMTVYHLATGTPTARFGDCPGEALFGVDADGFERSLYISQTSPFLPPDNNSIRSRLGALLDASEDLGNFERADDLLDTARRRYRVQGERGLIPDLTVQIRDKETEITAAIEAQASAAALSEERTAISQKYTEVTAALTEAKENRAIAEKRRIWEERAIMYHSLTEARDTAKAELSPLEEFFAPHLPTDEEMDAAEALAAECARLTSEIEHTVLSEDDENSLTRLRVRYGDTAPADEVTERLQTAYTAWKDAGIRLSAASARMNAPKDPLFTRFATEQPTEADASAIRAAVSAVEEAQALLYSQETPKKSHLPQFLLIGSGIFLSFSVLGFIFSLLALAIPALLLSIGALGAFGYLTVQSARLPREWQMRVNDQRIKERRLAFLLEPFGYTDKSPLAAASRFFSDRERFVLLKAEEQRQKEEYAACVRAEADAERALQAALSLSEPTGLAAEAERVLHDVPEYRRLLKKQSDLAMRRDALAAERQIAADKLQSFISLYPSLSGITPREALDAIKQNLLLSRQALATYTAARNRAANYLQNTRFDPDCPPPPFLGDIRALVDTEAQLQQSATELASLASVKENEQKHLWEIASTLPTLTAELDALRASLAEAEHTYSLILTTKEILSAAKEDLSTRYLRDMELHFDRYYQKITQSVTAELPSDGSRISPFTMDTSLALSCESYGERRPVTVLSRGERDLVAFCARLSLLESIFTKEPPFLLLDDPFINLDDENYEKATRLLAFLSERFQIIYTVCSTARLPAGIPPKQFCTNE